MFETTETLDYTQGRMNKKAQRNTDNLFKSLSRVPNRLVWVCQEINMLGYLNSAVSQVDLQQATAQKK